MKVFNVTTTVLCLALASCGDRSTKKEENQSAPSPNSEVMPSPTPSSPQNEEATKSPVATEPTPNSGSETPQEQPTVSPTPALKAVNELLYGSWTIPAIENGNLLKFKIFLKFEPSKVTVIAECKSGGLTNYAYASSAASYTSDEINVIDDVSSVEESQGLRCKASTSKGVLKYNVTKDELILMKDDKKQIMTRLQE